MVRKIVLAFEFVHVYPVHEVFLPVDIPGHAKVCNLGDPVTCLASEKDVPGCNVSVNKASGL